MKRSSLWFGLTLAGTLGLMLLGVPFFPALLFSGLTASLVALTPAHVHIQPSFGFGWPIFRRGPTVIHTNRTHVPHCNPPLVTHRAPIITAPPLVTHRAPIITAPPLVTHRAPIITAPPSRGLFPSFGSSLGSLFSGSSRCGSTFSTHGPAVHLGTTLRARH